MAKINFQTIPDEIEYLDQCYGENNIRFAVTHNVTSKWTMNGKDYEIVIPAGFVTNFASVPVFFRNIISPLGGHNPVTLVHDYIYTVHNGISRSDADTMLRCACIERGIPKIKAWMIWLAVRACGLSHWT